MIHKYRNFVTLHISKILLISNIGSKLKKIAITCIILIMIHFQTFILYSISVITIIIIDRRQSIIKINFIIKIWGAKKIVFIKRSNPKLMALHIISIKSIQRRHTNNIATIMSVVQIIKLHRLFYFLFKHFMSQLKIELIKLSHNFVVVFHKPN